MPEQWMTEAEFKEVAGKLDALVQEFEVLPFPQVREMAFDMLQLVDTLHREALHRLLTFLVAHGQGELVDHAADDPIVRTLLRLYDLVPNEEPPVERTPLETALHSTFPNLKELELERPVAAAQHHEIIPLIAAPRQPARTLRRPVFQTIAQVDEVPVGTMKAFDVAGTRVLVANVGGEFYAVHNSCPGSMAPLDLGSFSPPIVVCPWHNDAFDIRTGKRSDGVQGGGLAVLPIAIVDDSIQLAINTTTNGAAEGPPGHHR